MSAPFLAVVGLLTRTQRAGERETRSAGARPQPPAYVFAKQNRAMSSLLPPTKDSPFPTCRPIWKAGEGVDRPVLAGGRSRRPAAPKQSPARPIVQILLGPAGRFAEFCLEQPDHVLIRLRREGLCCDLAGENPAGQVPGVDVDRHRLVVAEAEQAYPIGGGPSDRRQLDQLRFRLPVVEALEPAGQGLRMPCRRWRASRIRLAAR